MQRERNRRHRGFDQRAEVSPVYRHVAAKLQVPADDRMHPQLEQNKRNQDSVEVDRLEMASPDVVQRLRIENVDGPEHDAENRGSRDQRLDPNQLGPQHFLCQRMFEIGRYRRLTHATVAPRPKHRVSLSFLKPQTELALILRSALARVSKDGKG